MNVNFPDIRWKRDFRRRLLDWFEREARDLPWRGTRDPYQIWVSEIMLQQTQVVSVIPYFQRFIGAFPTIRSLASAGEQEVLRRWEGLGYYRRARQLHQAAIVLVDTHGGHFPMDYDEVLSLPGIGRYTAGAILSIASDRRLPVLEANTTRVLSRLLLLREDPTKGPANRLLWEFAEALLPRKRCGSFNQALMELGSELCTPRDPDCGNCPVQRLCPTRANGLQAEIPVRPTKVAYETVRQACVVVWRRGRVLVRRCGQDERWSGLWDFPRFDLKARRGRSLRDELATKVVQLTGVSVDPGPRLLTIKHGVTRFRITLDCYESTHVAGDIDTEQMRWLKPDELDRYPLNTTGRKVTRRLQQRAGQAGEY